jgi:hypothetical protein
MRVSCLGSAPVSPRIFAKLFRSAGMVLAAAAVTGCGGHVPSGTIQPQGNTKVTFLLSAKANDRLTQYELNFQDLTLTNKAGTTVSVLTTAQNISGINTPEFMHLNGNTSTLLTTNVPDDTYTAATLTVGGAQITCVSVNSQDQSLTTSVFAYGATPQSQVTVNLPQPIVVSGDAMNLSMQLDMAKSYTLGECAGNTLDPYTITPTFSLTTADLSSPPTNYLSGKETDVLGEVSATTDSGFTIAIGYNPTAESSLPTQNITVNSATLYQGVSGLSALAMGTFVDMDLSAQADGSLVATRVAVSDPKAVNTFAGPALFAGSSSPVIYQLGQQSEGTDQLSTTGPYDVSTASFAVSGAFSNLSNLPFTPNFTAANIVPGQYLYVTSPSFTQTGMYNYPLANTVTLMAQTLDGVVTDVSSNGDFNVYTITLAPYDLFVDLAGQPGASNLIGQPSQVVVYADSSTSLAGVTEPQAGSTYLFHGLVFNDGGVLRMDCDQIAFGVAQ